MQENQKAPNWAGFEYLLGIIGALLGLLMYALFDKIGLGLVGTAITVVGGAWAYQKFHRVVGFITLLGVIAQVVLMMHP